MLLRNSDPGLEVLLLRRSDRAGFVPGAHVFPGGVVDQGDHDHRYRSHWIDGPPAEDLAHRVAAVRECLEEAGVLLARDGNQTVRNGHPVLTDLDRLRSDVERGEIDLATAVAAHGLRLGLEEMVYTARWVTPEESPRRYDARFYVAPMPAGQNPVADDREVSNAHWWRPSDALDAWRRDDILLIEPTVASLELLSDFGEVDDAMDTLRDLRPREETG